MDSDSIAFLAESRVTLLTVLPKSCASPEIGVLGRRWWHWSSSLSLIAA